MNKKYLLLPFYALNFYIPQTYADEKFLPYDNVNLSGYANVVYSSPQKGNSDLEVDDLSIFVSGKFNKWLNPFIEAELSSVPVWEESKGFRFNYANTGVERAYNDIQLNNENQLSIGKFLSPINHWNTVHAAPLVWTTNRPVTSYYSYSNYITGVKYKHDLNIITGHYIEAYWQPVEELNPPTKTNLPYRYKDIYGARWVGHEDIDLYFGLSGQYATVKNTNDKRATLSADLNWQFKNFDIESQAYITFVNSINSQYHNKDYGLYIQSAYPLYENKVYGIGRIEHYELSNFEKSTTTGTLGITYKPKQKISLKLEWQQTTGDQSLSPTGLFGSLAVLF